MYKMFYYNYLKKTEVIKYKYNMINYDRMSLDFQKIP